jgi:hypothetical protein
MLEGRIGNRSGTKGLPGSMLAQNAEMGPKSVAHSRPGGLLVG